MDWYENWAGTFAQKPARAFTQRVWVMPTDTLAILMETANPAQGRLRGATNEQLVLTGKGSYVMREQPS